jgi:hypothetical protein
MIIELFWTWVRFPPAPPIKQDYYNGGLNEEYINEVIEKDLINIKVEKVILIYVEIDK